MGRYWEDVIYNEVYEGRPVLIGALGHEFVRDGYDGKGYFHLNWGWEGINDGYYLLTTIDSYEQNSQRGSIKNLPFDQSDIITLIKLTNYLISNKIVDRKKNVLI